MGFIIGLIVVLGAMYLIPRLLERLAKERLGKLKALAEKLSMQFDESDSNNLVDAYTDMDFFNRGENRSVGNLLSGKSGDISVLIFDFKYEIITGTRNTPYGASSMAHIETVVLLDIPKLDLPVFEIVPTNQHHRMLEVTEARAIRFESDPAFFEKYNLTGRDKDAVRSFFEGEILDYFNESEGHFIGASGSRLLFHRTAAYSASTRISVDELEAHFQNCLKVAGVFLAKKG